MKKEGGAEYTTHGSPTAKTKPKEFLLSKRDLAIIQKGSPKVSKKLPKLAELNVRTVIDTKALG